jgi:hypothetical protein
MSLMGHYDHLIRKEMNRDLLRQVKRYERAVWRTRRARTGNALYCSALNWIGGHMIGWGQRLQKRYEPALQTPVPQAN